jgi:pyruvate/2-oxoglutarate dehydrogenase complex dihydrolipoamide acyltransferase (E2) component
MIEARVERPGFIHRGRRVAQDRHVIVTDAVYRQYGPAGTSHLSFVGHRDAEPESEIEATPGAERLANEAGVHLAKVTGTGADGRVTKDDVREYLRGHPRRG